MATVEIDAESALREALTTRRVQTEIANAIGEQLPAVLRQTMMAAVQQLRDDPAFKAACVEALREGYLDGLREKAKATAKRVPGECQGCEGSGRNLDSSLPRVLVGDEPVANWVKCSPCHGHGYVLGGFERELAQTIEAELGRRAA